MNDVLFPEERLFDSDDDHTESSGTQIEYDGKYRATTDVVNIYEMRGQEDKGAHIMAELLDAIRGAIVEANKTTKIAKRYMRAKERENNEFNCK